MDSAGVLRRSRCFDTVALGIWLALASLQAARASMVLPTSTEDAAGPSDAIVLGRVVDTDADAINVSSQPYTRHTLRVETYYKGTGPAEISLLTPGGFRTEVIGGKTLRTWSSTSGAEGARVGEEILAFLVAVDRRDVNDPQVQLTRGPFYRFYVWDGAKYLVNTDTETGVRTVELRLRKRKYMRGLALEGFDALAAMEEHKDLRQTGALPEHEFQTEIITIDDLPDRLGAIIKDEAERRAQVDRLLRTAPR